MVLLGALLAAAGPATATSPLALFHSTNSLHDACDMNEEQCFGIRPGALIQAEDWTACSASFIFANATDLFISTAAHCVSGEGNRVWFHNRNESAPGIDLLRPPEGETVFVPDEWNQPDYTAQMAQWDFAIIRINPHAYDDVNPRMCKWDGPYGIHSTPGDTQDRAYFYGHGVGISSVSPGRIGVGPRWDGGPIFYVRTAATNRDSGGPWIDAQGRAIGHETAMPRAVELTEGTDQGVHLAWLLNVTAEHGFPLTLVNASEDPLEVMARLQAASGRTPKATAADPEARAIPSPDIFAAFLLVGALALARRHPRRG